jgi:hypothetical protein
MVATVPSAQRVISFTALISLVILLVLAGRVSAGPAGTRDAPTVLGDHAAPCNVTFDAGGNLLLNGSALTGAQAALLDALLATDASLAAALDAAADADADTCINLAIDIPTASVLINGHVDACGAVDATAAVITVGGVTIGADLLSSELSDVLTAAALADVDACAFVTITGNEVVVDAVATICASATLLDTGAVNVVIGSDEFFFDGTLIDASGLLEVGVTAEVNLTVTATLDVAADTVDLTIVVTECAAGGGGTPSPTPTASPPGGGGGGGSPSPGAGGSPIPGLPDTAAWGGAMGSAVVALVALLLLSFVGWASARARR